MTREWTFWLFVAILTLATLVVSVAIGVGVSRFLQNDPLAQIGRVVRDVQDGFQRGYAR